MRIGELARQAGCTVETVRYYEREGLLDPPERGENNYRLYGRDHLESLRFVRNCRVLEMSLEEIRALADLRRDPGKDCGGVNQLLDAHIAHVTERIGRLETLRGQLTALRGLCDRVAPLGDCAILRELSAVQEAREPGAGAASHVRGAHAACRKP
ncbi:HTH-type transcriptional regulator CueR [Fundidesulfovibrio magnetotacticus]|uniref:HTH-type transcriptional regulator CueR n=1 Tax=Fundidesulfovibrio magnetotacticus TaxID=2730080 RepID=A0A6V8LMK9_9BACT|nr:Cd(II)/Pb(II)-responsive transcriptional regulator [Fundidesulfovibrio magnetotacticus]GFK92934.1 HTH-type transcriptional regulator CueR [Fundidesulfovibrio magnetotacticus]